MYGFDAQPTAKTAEIALECQILLQLLPAKIKIFHYKKSTKKTVGGNVKWQNTVPKMSSDTTFTGPLNIDKN